MKTYIKSLHLVNFQSHKDTHIELTSGVNAFVGPSDCGKSSILRGLRWVLLNKPSGEDFRSHWGGRTEVTVELSSGHNITRYRDKSRENGYIITREGSKPQNYEAMGNDVPEPVKELLPVNELNWQSQMDSPFLLSNSPPEVARMLNAVADLSDIDTAATAISGMVRDNQADQRHVKATVQELEEDMKKYANLTTLERRVSILAKMDSQKQELQEKIRTLSEGIRKIREAREQHARTDGVVLDAVVVARLEGVSDAIREERLQIGNLGRVLANYARYEETVRETAPVIGAESLFGDTTRHENDLKRVNARVGVLRGLLVSYRSFREAWERHDAAVKVMTAEFDELMPDVCPLCGVDRTLA